MVLYLTILLVCYRHLSHITKLLNYQLHLLRFIRHSISISIDTIIASTYILPLFDYCNFILYYIFNIPKYSHTHISPFLSKLNLPHVRNTILYKTIILVHKAIYRYSPDYLASLLKLKLPIISNKGSTNTILLQLLPKQYLHSTNICAWKISVPYSWNILPTFIRTTPST